MWKHLRRQKAKPLIRAQQWKKHVERLKKIKTNSSSSQTTVEPLNPEIRGSDWLEMHLCCRYQVLSILSFYTPVFHTSQPTDDATFLHMYFLFLPFTVFLIKIYLHRHFCLMISQIPLSVCPATVDIFFCRPRQIVDYKTRLSINCVLSPKSSNSRARRCFRSIAKAARSRSLLIPSINETTDDLSDEGMKSSQLTLEVVQKPLPKTFQKRHLQLAPLSLSDICKYLALQEELFFIQALDQNLECFWCPWGQQAWRRMLLSYSDYTRWQFLMKASLVFAVFVVKWVWKVNHGLCSLHQLRFRQLFKETKTCLTYQHSLVKS